MIYTSYFAKLPMKALVVSISNSQPKGCNYPQLKPLVPDQALVDQVNLGNMSWNEFKQAYLTQLDRVHPQVWEQFRQYPGTLVLTSWEAPFCNSHRHVLREYMARMGILIKEYQTEGGCT